MLCCAVLCCYVGLEMLEMEREKKVAPHRGPWFRIAGLPLFSPATCPPCPPYPPLSLSPCHPYVHTATAAGVRYSRILPPPPPLYLLLQQTLLDSAGVRCCRCYCRHRRPGPPCCSRIRPCRRCRPRWPPPCALARPGLLPPGGCSSLLCPGLASGGGGAAGLCCCARAGHCRGAGLRHLSTGTGGSKGKLRGGAGARVWDGRVWGRLVALTCARAREGGQGGWQGGGGLGLGGSEEGGGEGL